MSAGVLDSTDLNSNTSGGQAQLPDMPPPPPVPLSDPEAQRPGRRRRFHEGGHGHRWHCPVTSCPLAAGGPHRGWASFESMQSHIDAHLSGALGGQVSIEWLRTNHRTRCRVCGLCVGVSRGVHPSCHATERRITSNRRHNPQTQPQPPSPGSVPSLMDVFSTPIPTIKHIPHRARAKLSKLLVRALAVVVLLNTTAAWTELLMLPKAVLCLPRGKTKPNALSTAAFTLDRLDRWESGERLSLWHDARRPSDTTRSPTSDTYKALRAETLAREGLDGKACAALCSTGLVSPSDATAAKVEDLHPRKPPPQRTPASELVWPVTISSEDVHRNLRGFPKGTAPGPTGLRIQHFLEACTLANKSVVLDQLCAVSDLLARGSAPDDLAPFLAGASVCASPKKKGGLRPIAVGESLRRLTAKCLCQEHKEAAETYLWPVQVGCGTRLGSEVAVHTVRQWCRRHAGNPGKVLVKIDFKNAFNCIDRSVFFREVQEVLPGLSRWVQWCYACSAHLFFGPFCLSSQTGVQQGDPLGPLLFSLALQPVVSRLARRGKQGNPGSPLDLCFFYLDDGLLAGDTEAVSSALHALHAASTSLGLTLEMSTSELVVFQDSVCQEVGDSFPTSLFRDPETGESMVLTHGCFEFRGAPVGTNDFCAAHTRDRAQKALPLLEAISDLADPQVGLRLLRHCSGFCKMVYSMRTVPASAHQDVLTEYDHYVRTAFTRLTGLDLTLDQWG